MCMSRHACIFSTAPGDYSMVNEQLVFPANSPANNQCVEVTLVQDGTVEGIEFFYINANSSTGDTARALIIIIDNDGRWWNSIHLYHKQCSIDSILKILSLNYFSRELFCSVQWLFNSSFYTHCAHIQKHVCLCAHIQKLSRNVNLYVCLWCNSQYCFTLRWAMLLAVCTFYQAGQRPTIGPNHFRVCCTIVCYITVSGITLFFLNY